MHRYELVLEPSGLWSVFDRASELPAERNGVVLNGLSQEEALEAQFFLVANDIKLARKSRQRSAK